MQNEGRKIGAKKGGFWAINLERICFLCTFAVAFEIQRRMWAAAQQRLSQLRDRLIQNWDKLIQNWDSLIRKEKSYRRDGNEKGDCCTLGCLHDMLC